MNINIKNVDKDEYLRASFVLRANGKTLSQAVRDMLKELSKDFDKKTK